MEVKFEVVDEYSVGDEARFRIRVVGTNIIFNVGANSRENALRKVREIAEKIKLREFIDHYIVKE